MIFFFSSEKCYQSSVSQSLICTGVAGPLSESFTGIHERFVLQKKPLLMMMMMMMEFTRIQYYSQNVELLGSEVRKNNETSIFLNWVALFSYRI